MKYTLNLKRNMQTLQIGLRALATVLLIFAAVSIQAQTWLPPAQASAAIETKINMVNTQLAAATPHSPLAYYYEASIHYYEILLDWSNKGNAFTADILMKFTSYAHYSTNEKDYNPVVDDVRLGLTTEATELLSN